MPRVSQGTIIEETNAVACMHLFTQMVDTGVFERNWDRMQGVMDQIGVKIRKKGPARELYNCLQRNLDASRARAGVREIRPL